MKRNALALLLGFVSLPSGVASCHAPLRRPAVLETPPARPAPRTVTARRPGARQEEHHERIGSKRESFENRAAFILAHTAEGKEDDITFGFEYERHLDEYWGVGGLIDFFEGDADEALLAVSFIYHPIHPVGFVAAPGYQLVEGEDDRLALRIGMTYEFELDERISLAPVIYTDFIEGGVRSAILGFALNYNF